MRLNKSERETFDLFGIEPDSKGGLKMKGPGVYKRIVTAWNGYSPETRKTVKVAGGVFALGAALGAAVVLVSHSVSSDAPDKPAPRPPSPGKQTAHNGASLKVQTPKGQPGMLRSAAGKSSPQLATVPNGTAVRVLSSAMAEGYRWYQVETPVGTGWMHANILGAA